METPFSSTALLVAIAAVLWMAYLVPVWVKRSEYLATERNATRLGQTLRVLAETAQASEELRAELRARDVWRKTRQAEKSLVEFGMSEHEKKARRRRQIRAITSLFTGIGLAAFIGAAFAQAAPWVLALTAAKVVTGLITLQRLARAARKDRRTNPVTPAQTAMGPASTVNPRAWTPPAIPEPLSVKRAIPSTGQTLPSREELLRQARVAAQQARPEEAAAEAETLAPVSAFDQMGLVAPTASSTRPNLDEVLQRRRAVS